MVICFGLKKKENQGNIKKKILKFAVVTLPFVILPKRRIYFVEF